MDYKAKNSLLKIAIILLATIMVAIGYYAYQKNKLEKININH